MIQKVTLNQVDLKAPPDFCWNCWEDEPTWTQGFNCVSSFWSGRFSETVATSGLQTSQWTSGCLTTTWGCQLPAWLRQMSRRLVFPWYPPSRCCAEWTGVWRARFQQITNHLGGGFQYSIFSPLFGEDSHFDYFFSKGLKPPTSHMFLSQKADAFLHFGNSNAVIFQVCRQHRRCHALGNSNGRWA